MLYSVQKKRFLSTSRMYSKNIYAKEVNISLREIHEYE